MMIKNGAAGAVFDHIKILFDFGLFRLYNMSPHGDDRLRRGRLVPGGESRGADLVKSAQKTSANTRTYSALPLAA